MRPFEFRCSTLAAAIVAAALPLAAGAQGAQSAQGSQGAQGSQRAQEAAKDHAEVKPPANATTSSAAARVDSQDTTLPAADRQFLDKAAIGGMAEVELGRLAQQKASSDRVKQFGQRMVEEHGKANSELEQIARDLGVQPPTGLDEKHEQGMQKLQKLSGAEFDRAYMSMMLEDHKRDVAEFERQTTTAQNEKLRQFAQKTLPVLKEHLQLAQSISQEVGKGKRAAGKAGSAGTESGSANTGGTAAGTVPADRTNPGMKGSGMRDPAGTDSKQGTAGSTGGTGAAGGAASPGGK